MLWDHLDPLSISPRSCLPPSMSHFIPGSFWPLHTPCYCSLEDAPPPTHPHTIVYSITFPVYSDVFSYLSSCLQFVDSLMIETTSNLKPIHLYQGLVEISERSVKEQEESATWDSAIRRQSCALKPASQTARWAKNPPANGRRHRHWDLILLWEDPMEEGRAAKPIFLPGESHEQRSLLGYSPWGPKPSDVNEWLSMHT